MRRYFLIFSVLFLSTLAIVSFADEPVYHCSEGAGICDNQCPPYGSGASCSFANDGCPSGTVCAPQVATNCTDAEVYKCTASTSNPCEGECSGPGDNSPCTAIYGAGWECSQNQVNVSAYPWNCIIPGQTAYVCVQSALTCDDECELGDGTCGDGQICKDANITECEGNTDDGPTENRCMPAECADQCGPGLPPCGTGKVCTTSTLGICGDAAVSYCVNEVQNGGNSTGELPWFKPDYKDIDPMDLLVVVAKILFAGGLGIGLFFIVKAGWQIGTSLGSPDKVKEGTKQLTAAIIGIIFLLLSVGILNAIMSLSLGSYSTSPPIGGCGGGSALCD